MISGNSIESVDSALTKAISYVSQNIGCYVTNPGIDFSRHRNLTDEVLIRFLIQFQAKSINSELCDYFLNQSPPTPSAFCQQRAKLDPEALARVFHLFSDTAPIPNTWKGYQILACDGSDINIPYNPSDSETFMQSDPSVKGYNQLHLNALYDVLNGIYTNVMIDTRHKSHESGALIEMYEHFMPERPSILTADRGYERYELLAFLIENSLLFAIRVKDIESNGILSGLNLSDSEFDIDVTRILTRSQTKEIKENREKYTFLPSNVNFRYIDFDHETYELKLRVVRFKIADDTYECLVTNLPREEFSPSDLKDLYHLRWSEEGSFRKLKYDVGMIYFHSRKQSNVRQEIYAALILYNYTQLLINAVPVEKENKYVYKANFATAVTNARLFFKRLIDQREIIKRIKNFLIPIRPGRKSKRSIKGQSAKLFLYRAS